MKPAFLRHLLVLLAAPVVVWAQPSCGDCDCQCDASCCEPPPVRDTGVAVAVDDRAGAVSELQRLVSRYVENTRVREQILADVAREPEAAYRHVALRSLVFTPADAETYAAIGRQLDC